MFGLCWGGFLNVVAHRLITDVPVIGRRSHCPRCGCQLAWYDVIPLLSYIFLTGRCRACRQRISWLYPFIEFITALVFVALVFVVPMRFWFGYGLFFSALIVTVRTDIEYYAVLRICSLYLVPVGWILACLDLLCISCVSSLVGACVGYGALWLVERVYYALTGLHGMGQGDMELLACIGAFIGVAGLAPMVLIASFAGTLMALMLMMAGRVHRYSKIPFGPFLALAAGVYFFLWHLC